VIAKIVVLVVNVNFTEQERDFIDLKVIFNKTQFIFRLKLYRFNFFEIGVGGLCNKVVSFVSK